MRIASVYRRAPPSIPVVRERLVYERLQQALARLADLDCHSLTEVVDAASDEIAPGLMLVGAGMPVIALGREAHLALSSVRKRSLIAQDLDLTKATGGGTEDEIARLVWSSVNTTRLVALGPGAWQCAQLLPVVERRKRHVPPLQAHPAAEDAPSVLVINHRARGAEARAVTNALAASGVSVRLTGMTAAASDVPADAAWSDPAWIHVHVGAHTLDSEDIRLPDSWHSDRVALQLAIPGDASAPSGDTPVLTIADQANGFVCGTPAEIVALCRDLIDDPILRHRLIGFGRNSVASPLKEWDVLAADLLA